MDKPRLIDADKIEKWAQEQKKAIRESEGYSELYSVGRISSYDHFINALEEGSFTPDPIPLPTIKPGDMVKSNGVVVQVDEKFATIEDYVGNRYHALLDSLEVVE
ncbi:hypothetical protein [Paenibacillus sp. SN-8-1]|uniref:hypothetical protein n=1 Tax=Paenibacillus sp. SN-8-1 TaxID=3435409 RepID=UPI003D9A9C89